MAPHPLHDLIQSIHIDHSSLTSPSRFILISKVIDDNDEEEDWELTLLGETGTSLHCWHSTRALSEIPAEEGVLRDAIQGGFLHIELKGQKDLGDLDVLEFQFHPPGKEVVTVELELNPEIPTHQLFDAALHLLSRPAGGGDRSEIRGLRAEISQKDAEILHLNAKLQSAKATMARASGSNSKKVPISPSKKPPANASGLQPNQKRRKAVVDEFAGSSDESMEEDA